jgi:hypothetical protein
MPQRKYLQVKDSHDHRDFTFHAPHHHLKNVYLFDSHNTPPVVDQGELGSCTANAGGSGGFHFALMNKPQSAPNPEAELYNPSRLFLYYNTRLLMGTTDEDSGASIRDTMKAIAKYGVCQEIKWPYDISQFTTQPPQECYDQAAKLSNFSYNRLHGQSREAIVAALSSGYPVVYGMLIFQSFESQEVAQTGEVPYPTEGEKRLGGHALSIWGYNAEKDYFLVRNSWGKDWGINGYCHVPAEYVTNPNLAWDFWVLKYPDGTSQTNEQ